MARKSRGILRDMSKYYQDRIKSSKILEIKLLLEIFVFLSFEMPKSIENHFDSSLFVFFPNPQIFQAMRRIRIVRRSEN